MGGLSVGSSLALHHGMDRRSKADGHEEGRKTFFGLCFPILPTLSLGRGLTHHLLRYHYSPA